MAASGAVDASSDRWQALRPSNDMQDRDSVMAQPVPRGHRYQFSITRQRKTARYIAYKHNANLASKEFVMAACQQLSMTRDVCVLSSEHNTFDRHGQSYVGKLKSNVVGNAYTVLDVGHSVKVRKPPPDVVSSQCELASIHYSAAVNRPRIITVILPAINGNCQPTHVTTTPKHDGLLEKYRNGNQSEVIVLRNKPPVWDPDRKTYVLNFFGRVLQASVKNFQLIDSNDDIVLQFGRRSKNQFALDFTYPLNTIQAFGIAVSAMGNKFR